MEYTIPTFPEIHGDVIPLRYVAETMARKAASGFGKLKLHVPSLINIRPQYISLLLKAARDGQLKVCSGRGSVGTVDEVVLAAEGFENIPEGIEDDQKVILILHVKFYHLTKWGQENGDVFSLQDIPSHVFEYGPEREDGTKEYRGHGGEWPFHFLDRESPETLAIDVRQVYWRGVLRNEINKIDGANNGKANVRTVIKALKTLGDSRIPNEGKAGTLIWIDNNGTKQEVIQKTVSTAMSEARKVPA